MGDNVPTQRGRRSAEFWVRSHVPAGIDRDQHALVERLEALVDEDRLVDVRVRSWNGEIALSRTAGEAPESRIVLERVAGFRAWARRTGRSLAPFFGTRESESTITGECHARQVLPIRALVEYRDGEVVHVAPCTDPGGETVGVRDRLNELERAAAGASDVTRDRQSPRRVPEQ